MEPSNKYRSGVHLTHSCSPHRHHSHNCSPCPHRSPSPLKPPTIRDEPRFAHEPSDEKRYEERREQELRRQLAQTHQSSPTYENRLQMRIKNSLSYREDTSPIRPNPLSVRPPLPLAHHLAEPRDPRVDPHLSVGASQQKKMTPRSILLKPRELDSLPQRPTLSDAPQQFTISRGGSIGTLHGSQQHQHGSNEYTSQLQNDNQQLQRRLNLVVAELDRVNREKILQTNQLNLANTECKNFQRALDQQNRDSPSKQAYEHDLNRQKDENQHFRQKLDQLEDERGKTLAKLNVLQSHRERAVQDSENISKGLNAKVHAMRSIEHHQVTAHERAAEVGQQIQVLEQQIKEQHHRIPELTHLLDNLKHERDTLLHKLKNLNQTYDHAVHDISRERAQLEAHNRRHNQLMAAKAFHRLFTQMQLDRKQSAFNEFEAYCNFDRNCHDVLSRFTQVLLNCGQYQMKIGLKRWFQNALKPVATRKQGFDLARSFYHQKLKLRALKQWQRKYAAEAAKHEGKLKAVKAMWRLKRKDCRLIVQEFFTDWRIQTKLREQQQRVLRILSERQQMNLIRQAFHSLSHFNISVTHSLMEYCLRSNATNLQLMSIAFGQLKQRFTLKQRIRRNKLAHFFRSWQNAQAYQRQLWAQDRSLNNLKRKIDLRIISGCFHAIRLDKEQSKLNLMTEQLNGNYKVAISHLQDQIQTRSSQALKTKKLRAFTGLERQARCILASYFYHWERVQLGAKERTNKNFKMLLIRKMYQNQLRAHTTWVNGANDHKKRFQVKTNALLAQEGQNLRTDLGELTSEVQSEKDRQLRMSRARLAKGVAICTRRFLHQGIKRWARRIHYLHACEGSADFFFKMERKWMVKQGFALFQSKIKQKKQLEKDEARANHFILTHKQRTKRTIFNALCQYLHQYKRAKRIMQVLCSNIELWNVRKFYLLWQVKANLKATQLAQALQNQKVDEFEKLNAKLGKEVQNLVERQADNLKTQKQLKAQAQRVMSNVFARMYYSKIERCYRKWVKGIEFDKHRKQLVKGKIDIFIKTKMYVMKMALQNWRNQCKKSDLKVEINLSQQEGEKSNQEMIFNREKHALNQKQMSHDIKTLKKESKIPEAHAKNVLNNQIYMSKNFHFQSLKRAVIRAWRRHNKEQRQGCQAIKNALEKSMWKIGFNTIYDRARKVNRQETEARCALGLKRMFFKLACKHAMDVWRQNLFLQATLTSQICNMTSGQENDDHESWLVRVYNWTQQKGLMFKQQKHLHMIFKAWKQVHHWEKSKRVRTEIMREKWELYLQKRALLKLAYKVTYTKKVRSITQKLQEKSQQIWYRAVWNAILKCNQLDKQMSFTLGNAAFKYDVWMKENAVKSIWAEAELQKATSEIAKKVGASNLMSKLNSIYQIRMTQNLSDLRTRTYNKKARYLKMKSALSHFANGGMRRGFFTWKRFAFKEFTVDEVNEVGPVVEDVLREQMRVKNSKEFLKDQAYTPKEVSEITNWAEKRQKEHISRGVARIQHQDPETWGEDAYLKPVVFDRWRQFVKHRQVIKHILQNIENKLNPSTADLSFAFNRWKYSKRHLLAGIDRRNLMAKCGNDERHKQQLESLEDSATQFMTQMEIQRDELVDNYIKSQRLAIATARDQQERAQIRALTTICDNSHHQKKKNLELILSRNINLIQSLKDRIRDFERENDTMAGENEELRQFSLDGYQIAKNVQSLSAERESLSVDLADKSRMIQKLLDQNHDLSVQLRQAQERAIGLINQSNAHMQRGQHNNNHPYH